MLVTVVAVVIRGVAVFQCVVGGRDSFVSQLLNGIDVQHDVVLTSSTFALGLQLTAHKGERTFRAHVNFLLSPVLNSRWLCLRSVCSQ